MDWDDPEADRRRRLSPEAAAVEADALAAAELAVRSGSLDLSYFRITALPPEITAMPWLTSLDCSSTQVSDLSPLSGLTALALLYCYNTQVSDLSPLSGLTALASLHCSYTQVSDLSSLSGLTALASLDCSGTQLSDLSPLAGLTALAKLNCWETKVSDLSPLADLTALASLNCCRTQVSDLSPLSNLTALASLDCSSTQVNDLSPLSSLTTLAELDCQLTPVSDLRSLSRLTTLTALGCGSEKVSDLSPLSGLIALTDLSCRGPNVIDLGPLSRLTELAALDCSYSRVIDLSPLSGLAELEFLDCSYSRVSDLSPLSGLTALVSLVCGNNPVSDLSPLVGLAALDSLDCRNALVSDLSLLRCHPRLSHLIAYNLPNCPIPSEHLSQDYDSCLTRLRAYWDNLDGGAEPFRQHKLFLLGNGTVGKTEVAMALRGKPYVERRGSTHGIQLETHRLSAPADPRHADAGEHFTAKIWDFGGQDIYHGTHALFLKTRAIFLICWEGDSERTREHVIDGVPYRNRKLAYWRDYVRQFAGPHAEVILVQTKNDKPGSAADAAAMEAVYPDCPSCSTSAQDGEGFNRLKRLIAEAVGRIEAPALPIIPSSQRRVIDAITAARKAGTRTLDREAFAALCGECGLIGAPEHMLHFLHHTGEVFHAEGRFGGQIIVDQRWALDAIYAVFDRDQCWQRIKSERGRFTLALLAETVWQAFSPADHKHLLAMMLQCGMAFRYIDGEKGEREAIYIAPDLLPDFDDPAVQSWYLREWDPEGASQTCRIPVPLLHDGLIRALMVEIGKDAGMWAVYWKNGVLFHDMTTRALATIEARWPDPEGWAGEIVITTQRSRARELLEVLERHVRDVAKRIGVPFDETGAWGRTIDLIDFVTRPLSAHRPRSQRPTPISGTTFAPGRGSPRVPSCYVSYAWGDGTEQADANERMVDDLCASAAARGIEIIRDKTHLASGESIDAFSEEIARAERVAAMIGGRYWYRPDCFAELFGCWKEAKLESELFQQKVRPFALPDAEIYAEDIVERVVTHWDNAFAQHDAASARHSNRHSELVRRQADTWAAQARHIIATLQGRVRRYEGDFEAFKNELFTELEALRYKPDHDPEA